MSKIFRALSPLAAAAAFAALSLLGADAAARSVELRAELGNPVMLAHQSNTAVLKVSLRGLDLASEAERPPVNLAIVLDKSGSMSGEKLAEAKSAALHVVDRLRPDDLVSVVAYDGRVRVLVPTTRVSERARISEAILGLQASGSTALFAGVSKGIGEVRKFLRSGQVNRVILLSDGKANVGPSSANALGRLGAACAKEQISITTVGLGLGYNEDLMVQLAKRSDGNHAFAAEATELASLFSSELGDITSVVAQGALVRIDLGAGVRPLRVLNRDATIAGQSVTFTLNQVYGGQEKYVLLEAEVVPAYPGASMPLATVSATYLDLISGRSENERKMVSVRFSDSPMEVDAAQTPGVMVAHAEAIANERNRLALDLRDRGELREAQVVLENNSDYLNTAAARYNAPKLRKQAADNVSDANNLEGERWNKQRKVMRKRQYELDVQQSF
jgi:Ca-activated chloride channel family protein